MSLEKNDIDILKSTAHDLNNIFTSILNSVELLKIKTKDENLFQLVRNIENNSIRAAEIIDGLLLSDSDKKRLKSQLSIKKLFCDLELTIKKLFGTDALVEVSIEKNILDIYGNYSELFRVLLNLCVNAKESTSGNSKINISAVNFDSTNSKIPHKLNIKNWILIKITDNGHGISEENIQRIFDNGFSTKNGKKTSGLGLAIVKQIVDEHEGIIEVSSVVGKGTTFNIYLPAKPIVDNANSNPYSNAILIVDDSIEIADELAELLVFEHYNPTVASSGEIVLKMLSEGKKFDLFIIDKKMPGMSGIELIEKIRKINPTVPIILASGSIPLGDEKRVGELRINKFLKKPYLFESMVKNIRDLI